MKIVEESGSRLVMKDNNFTNLFLGILFIVISLGLFALVQTEAFNLKGQSLWIFYLLDLAFLLGGILTIISWKTVWIKADKSAGLLTLSSKSILSKNQDVLQFSDIASVIVIYYYKYSSGRRRALGRTTTRKIHYNSFIELKNGRRIAYDSGGEGVKFGSIFANPSVDNRRERDEANRIASFIGVQSKEQSPVDPMELGKELLQGILNYQGKTPEEMKTEAEKLKKEIEQRNQDQHKYS